VVWVVDPEVRTISVYRSLGEIVVLDEDDALTGGDILPGFSVRVAEVFA
jgi:Uma2 family endonuclease